MKFTAWQIYTGSPKSEIEKALQNGEIENNDTVFCGNGKIVICESPADLEED